jgi:hypothetical protein
VKKRFSYQYKATIGADFLSKEISIEATLAQLQVKHLGSFGIQLEKRNFTQWDHFFIEDQNAAL